MIIQRTFCFPLRFLSLLIYSGVLAIWQTNLYAQSPTEYSTDYQLIIEQLQQKLTQAKTDPQVALLHSQLGDAYFANQQLIEAEQSLEKALILAQKHKNPAVLMHILNNQGNLYSVIQQDEAALKAYAQVRKLAKQSQDPLAQTQVLLNSLRLYLRRQDKQALTQYWQQLQQNLSQLQQQAHYQLSSAHLGLAIYQFAPDLIQLSTLQQQLQHLAQHSQTPRHRSQAYGLLAQIYTQKHQYDKAQQLTQQAIFFAQNIPDLLYYWEWQQAGLFQNQGQAQAAEQSYRQALQHLKPIRQRLTQGRRDALNIFVERIRPVYFDLAAILLKQAETAPIAQQQNLLKSARDTVEQLKIAELEDYFQDECVAAAKARSQTGFNIQADTAVLYPIMLKNRTVLLLQTQAGLKQIPIAVNYQKLNQTALSFHYNLQNSASNRFIQDAKQLYQWLISPIKTQLQQAKIKTLLLVPDAALRLIPLAALYNPSKHQFLISEYAIAITPSLQLTDIRPLHRPNLKILVNGLSQGVQEFSALPNVPAEVNSIGKLFKNNQVLMNKDFSLKQFSSHLQQNPYEIVHIASHGQFNRDPRKTFLLTHDDKLTMNKLEELLKQSQQQDQAIELLTLSACQTAVGDDRAALGLAGVAIKAGARSALASLWFVNDAATSELVVRFYQKIQHQKLSKAEALRQAQLELLQQRIFRHPAYWAAFTLIGNWL